MPMDLAPPLLLALPLPLEDVSVQGPTHKKKRKKWKPLITGGFQGNLISQINATSVTKS